MAFNLALIKPACAATPQGENTYIMSGFTPGTKVSLKALSHNGMATQNDAAIDQDGNLNLPIKSIGSIKAYDIRIENEDKEPINLLIRVDNQNDKITATGNGLDTFSAITLKTANDDVQTKADWAGMFAQDMALSQGSKDSQSFEIALYGMNLIDVLPSNSIKPGIIQVLSANGGGGPTSSGVNSFSPSASPLSTSSSSAINANITAIKQNYVRALMLMTEQFSAIGMQQVLSIGQFFDAKTQLEAQRLQQELKSQAVKDYHPSDQMCRVGTYVRSLAKAEAKSAADKSKMNEILMSKYTGEFGASTAEAETSDTYARIKQFREVYCNRADNNNGLDYMCEHNQDQWITAGEDIGGPIRERRNKDIDFLRTIDSIKTLDIDFSDGIASGDEEDVLALAANLYWPSPIRWPVGTEILKKEPAYLKAKRVIALNNIAHNSYISVAAAKARAEDPATGVEPGWIYMKSFLREFGISDDDIEQWVGENPSYWAQMEILTKRMAQSPNFYTNLYDKPVNVDRMSVALEAIKLMQMRDHFDASLRSELLKSALLEVELEPQLNAAQNGFLKR